MRKVRPSGWERRTLNASTTRLTAGIFLILALAPNKGEGSLTILFKEFGYRPPFCEINS